ncbi:protein kinase [Chloracidobacterium sp. D]|uniref:two-component regulator propeller domain-containing protein n=1 Tax=Chloracidobacterium sp. D TaxID=2821536 RepID=UPI001B8B6589|nr:two-component regulator propeller domain-containing protein [Chloracidobacterium sp. D]QUV82632.1 protein kinase [Chloracidobacterium sp. D]
MSRLSAHLFGIGIWVCLWWALGMASEGRSLRDYTLDAWRDELPQAAVLALAQDRQGYLWIGTYEGLVRFDGVRFATFDKRTTPAFRNHNIRCIFEDRDGTLWIGTFGGGVVRYRDGVFEALTTEQGLASDFVLDIAQTPDGALWFATSRGLTHWHQNQWQTLTIKDGLPLDSLQQLALAPDGTLWIATYGRGLSALRNGVFHNHSLNGGKPNDIVFALHVARDGTVWAGTNQQGLLHLDAQGQILTQYARRTGFPDDAVHALYEDTDGALWVGIENGGLGRFSQGRWDWRTPKDGLLHRFVRAICCDHEGSCWVGTNGGLNRLREARIVNLSTYHGLTDANVRVVLEDSQGRLWVGLDEAGIDCLEKGQWKHYGLETGMKTLGVRSITEDTQGRIWFGLNQGGILCFANGRWRSITTADGLTNDNVYAVCAAQDGTLWVGTVGGGINVLREGQVIRTIDAQSENITGGNIRVIAQLRDNAMWIGTNGRGLIRVQGEDITRFTVKEGLPSNLVFALHEAADGTLWIGTGGGLAWYREGRFGTITHKDGLFDDTVFAILPDAADNFWMSCNRGIFRLDRREREAFLSGAQSQVNCTTFDLSDGMGANQCNGTSQPCAMRLRDGRLAFATIGGLALLAPERLPFNAQPPAVVIESVITERQTFLAPTQVVIEPGTGKFEIHYTALSFLAPQRMRFRFRLEGFDESWVEAATRRTAYYTNLPPGTYRFHVTACNNDGVWNESGTTATLVVKPFFYQTLWARGLGLLVLSLLVLGGFRWRTLTLRHRAAALERQVAVRTAQLNEKNAALERALQEIQAAQQEANLKNRELGRKNEALLELHRQANAIFTALTDVLPGTVIAGKYRLVKKIGGGGFGVVYQAEQVALQRPVAIKIFRPSGKNATTASVERFRREGISACRINHPNAVSVIDFGVSEDGIAYLVMELLQGVSLATELKLCGALPVERSIAIMLPVCDVLATAHEAGVIHRDIKPDNIFLHQTPEGEVVKVVDFGIAKLLEPDADDPLAGITETGGVVGTPIYMSPERLDDRPYDGRSDVYSAGVVLYEMLTGRVPFPPTGKGTLGVIIGHLRQPPPPLEGIPAKVADVVLQALAKSPDARPTAREFGNRLAAAAGLHAYRSTTATTGRLAGRVSSTPEEDDGVTVLPESQDTLLLERSQTDASHAPDTQPTKANLAGANRTDEQNR